jgi:ABC-type branched-subunit amino acid transport system permease subunit
MHDHAPIKVLACHSLFQASAGASTVLPFPFHPSDSWPQPSAAAGADLLGGIGTLSGPILGAFVLTGVFELANIYIPEVHPIFSGLFVILVMLFLPQGIMSLGGKGFVSRLFPVMFGLSQQKERR